MNSKFDKIASRKETTNWGVLPRVLVAMALLLPALSFVPRAEAASNVQPQLQAMAVQRPDAKLGVIVQKTSTGNSVERLVAQLGGKVIRDLHIINAFVAELPGKAVSQLATAQGVRWMSLDAPVSGSSTSADAIGTANLLNAYDRAVGSDRLWNSATYLQGQGVGVAVIDSGVKSNLNDFGSSSYGSRVVAQVKLNSFSNSATDQYGHGTHVAGIIAGNGGNCGGNYVGIAPKANLVNVKVSDDVGAATASDVVNGMQWVLDNKAAYNIRVVNLSLNTTVADSYNTDPMDAAAEVLWFNKIVVVTSAGNNGTANLYAPANDPFVITVGATDDKGTASILDDTIASFSAYGTTADGFAKPDLVAPGTNIVSLSAGNGTTLVQDHPSNTVGSNYFRMSGTSMAAPMVSGAVALLLQDEPNLTPDQVKYRLKNTAVKTTTRWPAYNATKAGSGYLDVYAAVTGTGTTSANTNIAASQLLWTGSQPLTWGSVNWNSVNWNSVNWNSVNWNSVNWNSVNWNSDYWGR